MKKVIIILLFVATKVAFAQDPIFTQSFLIPETINTGFTGSQESFRAGIIHRVQWPGVNFSMNTQFAFADTWVESINSGVGVSIINHQESTTRYRFSQINYNHSLAIQLTNSWYFRPSISAGLGMKSFGFQNLLLEDQINIRTGIINTATIDPALLNDQLMFVDFSASMLFNNESSWFGFTLRHLTKPDIAFTFQGNVPLEMFFSAHGAINVMDFIPSFNNSFGDNHKLYVLGNYMKQAQYSRIDLGSQWVYDRFSLGIVGVMTPNRNNTLNDNFLASVNVLAGFKWEGWKFSYSQDFTTNSIGNTGGIYEIMITYDFGDTRTGGARCPRIF